VAGAGLKGRKTEQIWQVEVELKGMETAWVAEAKSMQMEREQAWVLEVETNVVRMEDFHDLLRGNGWLFRKLFLP
jgi:hypothetical protein